MIIDNIFNFLLLRGIAVSEISNKISVSNGYFAKTRKNRGNVGGHILEKIVSCYPEINPEWLLTGSGQMIRLEFETNMISETNRLRETEEKNITLKIPYLDHVTVKEDSSVCSVRKI